MTSDKLMLFFTLCPAQIRACLDCLVVSLHKFATKHSTAVVVVVAVVVVTVLNVPSLSTFHLASVPIMSSVRSQEQCREAQLAAIHCCNNTDTDITIHLAMEIGEGGSWGDY